MKNMWFCKLCSGIAELSLFFIIKCRSCEIISKFSDHTSLSAIGAEIIGFLQEFSVCFRKIDSNFQFLSSIIKYRLFMDQLLLLCESDREIQHVLLYT